MARKTNLRDLAPVLKAAKNWIDRCLIGDQSLFYDDVLWTEENAVQLRQHFVDKPDESNRSFIEKLSGQLATASPAARQLMAEIFWAIRLFPVTPKVPTKRQQFFEVWKLCGRPLSEQHPMLREETLSGIGSAGTAYLAQPWREIAFLVQLLQQLKVIQREEREALFSANERLSPWLDTVVTSGERQFPHILRYFAFPDTIERISSGIEKKKILRGFDIAIPNSASALQVDQALLELRRKQEAKYPGQDLDFYHTPLMEEWKGEDPNPDGGKVVVSPLPEPPLSAMKRPLGGSVIHSPINRIYYGPPGTGKTHALLGLLSNYEESTGSASREEWLASIVSDYGWRAVIAASLSTAPDGMRVPQLLRHELMMAKAKVLGRQANLSQTTWGYLGEHTPPEVSQVQSKIRRPPFVFTKSADSRWSLVSDWEEVDQEAKTLASDYRKGAAADNRIIKRYRTVTFHPAYCYEDFVRGIRPVATDDQDRTIFRMVDGIFKQVCDEARAHPNKRYALFIDEINRGNIAKIFGELIMLIEPDKRVVADADGRVTAGMTVQLPGGNPGETLEAPFGVPANLDIFGTMNTADRSIALLDVALRRRFEFVEMPPRYDEQVFPVAVAGVDRGKLLERINDRIEYLLDRDHRIGHAYLMKAHGLADLRSAFANQILPLLQEYFFDDLSKVAITLSGPDGSSAFVRKEELRHSRLFPGRRGGTEVNRARYVVTDPSEWTTEAFQGLYADPTSTASAGTDEAVD